MARSLYYLILIACAAEMATGFYLAADLAEPSRPVDKAYDVFRQQHRPGEDPSEDLVSYAMRASLFQARSAEVASHNAQPGVSYKKEVNRFADHTDGELRGMLGYRRVGHLKAAAGSGSFLEVKPSLKALASSVDWRSKLNNSRNFLRDQGACGSCWAVAAVGALEMHAEALHGSTEPLSFEELVDCVPNPQHCGGDGGCKGATAELAFEYVKQHGLSAAKGYRGYMSGGNGQCNALGNATQKTTKSEGWERLPENKLYSLMEAVANKGPVVVSVDASGWNSYASGVYDGCSQNATVNHAVVVVGYGTDSDLGKDYWLIRNSWGDGWGESGHIRLQRHASDQGDAGYCGTDKSPLEGVGCAGGPSEIPVCGMCGVLSDSSYPKGVHISR
jgi:cathepsin L